MASKLSAHFPKLYTIICISIFIIIGYLGYDSASSGKNLAAGIGKDAKISSPGDKSLSDGESIDCNSKKFLVDSPDALCIDGTKPAYYYRKGFGDGTSKFHIHFEGGGWCYTPESCVFRATTPLGSSKDYSSCMISNHNNNAPYLSDDNSTNSVSHNWNTIFVRYCDGGSYAGNADITHKGKRLFFRGHNIRNAIIEDLYTNHNMNIATHVLISGCSAGALGVLLGADEMASAITLRSIHGKKLVVKLLVDSGVFLDFSYGKKDYDADFEYQEALTPTGALDFSAAMRNIFHFMNLSSGTNEDCLRSLSKHNKADYCIFTENLGKYVRAPLFFIQPQYDSWQLRHVLGKPSNATMVNQFGGKIKSIMKSLLSAVPQSKRNTSHGGFLDSCVHHCMSCRNTPENLWGGNKIKDSFSGLEMGQAFEKWWHGPNKNPHNKNAQSHQLFYMQDSVYPCSDCCSCTLYS